MSRMLRLRTIDLVFASVMGIAVMAGIAQVALRLYHLALVAFMAAGHRFRRARR